MIGKICALSILGLILGLASVPTSRQVPPVSAHARDDFESRDAAKPCGCKDALKVADRAQRAKKAEEAWKEIFAWARGLHRDIPLPESNDELNARFGQLMKAPQSEWDRILHQPVDLSAIPPPIAGINDKGEAVITQDFVEQNCDEIVQAVRVHEETHKRFFLGNPVKVLGELLRVRAESEVESYRAEKEFLSQLLKAIDEDCCKQNKGGWFGTITFSHVRNIETHSGPVKSGIHATRTHELKHIDKIERYESIQITGVKSVIAGESDVSNEKDVTADLEAAATGNFTSKNRDDDFQREEEGCPDSLGGGTKSISNHTFLQEIQNSGDVKGIARVHVVINGDRYSFWYRGPDYVVKIENTYSSITTGGCRPELNLTTGPSTLNSSSRFHGSAEVEGKHIDPKNPNVLEGSESRPDGVSSGGTITIRWRLRICQ